MLAWIYHFVMWQLSTQLNSTLNKKLCFHTDNSASVVIYSPVLDKIFLGICVNAFENGCAVSRAIVTQRRLLSSQEKTTTYCAYVSKLLTESIRTCRCLQWIMDSFMVTSANIAITDISLKARFLCFIFVTESIGCLQPLLRRPMGPESYWIRWNNVK